MPDPRWSARVKAPGRAKKFLNNYREQRGVGGCDGGDDSSTGWGERRGGRGRDGEGLQLSRIAVGSPFPQPLFSWASLPARSPSLLPAGINGKSLLLSFKRPATLLISNFGRYLYLLQRGFECTGTTSNAVTTLLTDRKSPPFILSARGI